MRPPFTYYALYLRQDRSEPPVGLVAQGRAAPDLPLRTVGWSRRKEAWTEMAATLGAITVSPEWIDRFEIVDRATAERIALENLGTELPSEREMQRIGDEAAEKRRGARTRQT